MFFTRRRQAEFEEFFRRETLYHKAELETLVKSEQQKCVQEINRVIQSLRDNVQKIIDYCEIDKSSDDSPSKRASEYLQRLNAYQKQLDSMAGSVIEGAPPSPPEEHGQ